MFYLSFTIFFVLPREKHYLSYNYKEKNISCPTQFTCPTEKKTLFFLHNAIVLQLVLHNAFVLQRGNIVFPTRWICTTQRKTLLVLHNAFVLKREKRENIVFPKQCIFPKERKTFLSYTSQLYYKEKNIVLQRENFYLSY